MGFKDLFLQKGWAGKTLSRQETIEHVNPLLRRHHELNHCYSHLIDRLSDREAAAQLQDLMKVARADVSKLSETVLSAGGVSYNGTDLEPEDFNLGSNPVDVLREVQKREEDLQDALSEELDRGDHQMRTRAILGVVQTNSQRRLDLLDQLLREAQRRAPSS